MRYRRLSYRYIVLSSRQPRPLAYFNTTEHAMGLAQPVCEAPADMYETADSIVATIDIAGVDENDMELLLYEDALVLEGRRRLPRPLDDATYHLAEIREGPIRAEIRLPARVDPERVEATYDRGLLVVKLMKVGA